MGNGQSFPPPKRGEKWEIPNKAYAPFCIKVVKWGFPNKPYLNSYSMYFNCILVYTINIGISSYR